MVYERYLTEGFKEIFEKLKDKFKKPKYRPLTDKERNDLAKYARTLIKSTPKEKFIRVNEDYKLNEEEFLTEECDYLEIYKVDAWEYSDNIREDSVYSEFNNKIEQILKQLNNKVPKQYIFYTEGDWDTFTINIAYNNKYLKESEVYSMNAYLQSVLESSTITEEDMSLYDSSDIYEDVEEEVDMRLDPKTVPIIQTGVNEYAIKFEDLLQVTSYLAESEGDACDSLTIEKICMENGIPSGSLAVVIPSQLEFDMFTEACCKEAKGCDTEAGKAKSKKKVKTMKERIKGLKEKGIKVKKEK